MRYPNNSHPYRLIDELATKHHESRLSSAPGIFTVCHVLQIFEQARRNIEGTESKDSNIHYRPGMEDL